MAQDFTRYKARLTGTSAATIFTANSNDTIVGISLANVAATAITASVYINDGTNDFYLVKSAPIPVGSSLQVLDGGAKVVVQNGDILKVVSDTASSLDAWVSTVDAIS
ncbi:MAG: hypothetical protein EB137_02495 [Actinobacteria bacterium]|nr:hypothetical protein [Actinomycetota bacterium]